MNDNDVTNRLKRIESRLAQLMLHMGLDPAVRTYSTPRVMSQVWRYGALPTSA